MKDDVSPSRIRPNGRLDYLRLALMAGLCVISLGAIANQRVSQRGQVDPPTFAYPEQISLPSWQFKSVETAIVAGQPPGKRYTLQQGKNTAIITVFHQPHSDGNVSRLFVAYSEAKPATVYIHPLQHPQTGHFGAFVFENQPYLSACLNPNGLSTITEQQFVRNQYRYGLNLWGWLAGKTDLTDSRCLWTLITAPIAPDATPTENTQTFQQLETVWLEWYKWWQRHQTGEGDASVQRDGI